MKHPLMAAKKKLKIKGIIYYYHRHNVTIKTWVYTVKAYNSKNMSLWLTNTCMGFLSNKQYKQLLWVTEFSKTKHWVIELFYLKISYKI